MACGLPVLASNRRRLAALFLDDECGLLIESGDVTAWEAGLMNAAGSPAKRRRWGVRARERATKDLSWERIAEGFEEEILTRRTNAEGAPSQRSATPTVPE
jgi:glycosyltransferase involved in cell wall biosynthesis